MFQETAIFTQKRKMSFRKGFIVAILLSVSSIGCKKEEISQKTTNKSVQTAKEDIPNIANSFLNNYYPYSKIKSVSKEDILGFGKSYKVSLDSATVIIFDEKGIWKEISDNKGADKDLLPPTASEYIISEFPTEKIIKIETKKTNFLVQLSNKKNLNFDENGSLLK
jgi:hypothetical protein